MPNIVKYAEFTPEVAEQAQSELRTGKYMELKEGNTVVRVLPVPVEWGLRYPWVVVHEHFVELPDRKFSFACPRLTSKQQCPLCERADQMRSSGNAVDRDRASALYPRSRGYMNVIDKKAPERGVQILAASKTILDGMASIAQDPDSGGDFTSIRNGFSIIIERKGKDKQTKYQVRAARKVEPLAPTDEEVAEILESAKDLRDCVRLRTYDEIIEALQGDDGGSRRSLPSGRGRTAADDLEDEG